MSSNPPAEEQQPPPSAEEAVMTEELARDRPSMDAAVKSFISLVCARSLTASTTDAGANVAGKKADGSGVALAIINPNSTNSTGIQKEVLQVARAILKSINSYTFPVHKTVAITMAAKPGTTPEKRKELLEVSIVSRLWNGLVQSNQKPTRFLGRRALKLAWPDMNVKANLEAEWGQDASPESKNRQLEWLEEFERLLFHVHDDSVDEDDDSALLWDIDGGEKELAGRRQRRQNAATKRGPVTPS